LGAADHGRLIQNVERVGIGLQENADGDGGHVVVSKTNFLITLAPYFFPLYVAVVVVVFMAGHWLWSWASQRASPR